MNKPVDPSSTAPPPDASRVAGILAELELRPTIVNLSHAARTLLPHRDSLAAVPLRLGCLASFTFDPIRHALELQALRAGIAAQTHISPFGQFDQEMINPASALAAFRPDVILLAIRLSDVCPAIYDSFNSLSAEQARRMTHDWIDRLHCSILALRRHNTAPLLIQNYDLPPTPSLGIADAAVENSQTAIIQAADEQLAAMVRSMPNAYLLDYDALVARHGRATWSDPRLALFGRIPIAPAHYWSYAGFIIRHLRPLFGLTKKVLVLDADHTLWGGVVGDVGLGGIALGEDYPGNAYVAFQKKLLDLHQRGIVLCLASKNELATVEEVLSSHPSMVLRREHFAAMRVNWQPKPENLRAMASELNLGLDSFVFLDDSPVECDMMRSSLPQVLSICLPAEPAELPGLVDGLDCFDQWSISDEDRRRGAMYRAETDRRFLAATAIDLPTFYRQLKMRVTLTVNDDRLVSRISQMTQRTNQFNMNTVRCTEDEIRRLMNEPACRVISLALADRYGDNGVVGAAVVRTTPPEWSIEMLLMSCRVLGRTVEQAFVQWIAAEARAAGAASVTGLVVPTPKNKPFKDFYASCGFDAVQDPAAGQVWRLNVARAEPRLPDWIDLATGSPSEATA